MGRFEFVANRLGRALVDRLAAVVPEPFDIGWEDGDITLASRTTPRSAEIHVRALVDQDAGDLIENLEATTRNALYVVQDYITEVRGVAWPTEERAVLHGPGRIPMPRQNALITDDRLELWYGDAEAPVLQLPGISIASLVQPEPDR